MKKKETVIYAMPACKEQNIPSILFVDSSNEEEKLLYKVLKVPGIEYIVLDFNSADGDFTAQDLDDGETWDAKSFYRWLIDEVLVFTDNGILGMDKDLYKQFETFAHKRGICIRNNRRKIKEERRNDD